MPMNMWNHITEAGQVDFVWRKQLSDNNFNRKNYRHQM